MRSRATRAPSGRSPSTRAHSPTTVRRTGIHSTAWDARTRRTAAQRRDAEIEDARRQLHHAGAPPTVSVAVPRLAATGGWKSVSPAPRRAPAWGARARDRPAGQTPAPGRSRSPRRRGGGPRSRPARKRPLPWCAQIDLPLGGHIRSPSVDLRSLASARGAWNRALPGVAAPLDLGPRRRSEVRPSILHVTSEGNSVQPRSRPSPPRLARSARVPGARRSSWVVRSASRAAFQPERCSTQWDRR